MNKVFLIGHLTKDVELKTTPSGLSVASFSIATNKSVKKNDQWEKVAQFHNLVAWRHTAEALAKYTKKGAKIAIVGELQTRMWEKDGVKRYATEVIVSEVEFMSQANQSGNQETSQPAPADDYSQSEPNEDEIRVENIPF